MLKNYLKLAWRVLSRKKFFTFISLFGISFTLAILMLIISFLQTELGNNAPLSKKDKMVIMEMIEMQQVNPDTTMLLDSALVNGSMKYDTSYSYGESTSSTSNSSISNLFLEEYYTDIPSSVDYTFFAQNNSFNAYVNNSKIIVNVNYTDDRYWNILDFTFIEGHAYDHSSFEQAEPVAVITDELAMKYFGQNRNVLGKFVKLEGKSLKVIGVIQSPGSSLVDADLYAPYPLMSYLPSDLSTFFGSFSGILLADKPSNRAKIKDEIVFKAEQIPIDHIKDFNLLTFTGSTIPEFYASNMLRMHDSEKAKKILFAVLFGFISLFILLPTLNLINLNVSRIMERSSEIGVRKAFGASRLQVLFQFVFENVVLTVLGGIIGFILAYLLIYFINTERVLEHIQLQINIQFFLLSLAVILLFGILSGLLPALRMSKVHIVNALKEHKL